LGGLLDIDERLDSLRHVWKLTPVPITESMVNTKTRGVVVMLADGLGMNRFALGSS